MDGSEAIIKTLINNGTDVTFGYPGGAVIPLYNKFLEYEGEIKNILVRHEQGASHAADAYARILGKPGVCIATSGPGATNLVTGIMTAYMDSSPMIAIGGQVPTSLIGNDAFQESDMMGITIPITKHSFQIMNSNEIIETISKSYKIATEGRPGPIYIDLPKDVQDQKVTRDKPEKIHIHGFSPTLNGHPHQIKSAIELILSAERPLFLIGGGVIISNATNELYNLIEILKVPVITTLMGKGAFPENHPLCLGMLGMHGRKVANYAILNSDVIVAVGCRFSDRITGNLKSFAEDSKLIHIDIDPAEIKKNVENVDIPLVGDAKLILKDFIKGIKNKIKKNIKYTQWISRMKELRDVCQCSLERDEIPINPLRVCHELNKILKDTDIVTTGVGQQQMFAAHFLIRKKPRTFITSGGAGTMGFGLPAAIGAKVAKPNVDVFDIDGDGGFQMTMQELGTCVQNEIKIIPVIFNNAYLGMVRQWLEIFQNKRYSQVHIGRNPNFENVSKAYGLEGITVTRPGEINEALKKAKKSKDTVILDIHIEPESNILPMLPPGGHIRDAFGGCMVKKGKFW